MSIRAGAGAPSRGKIGAVEILCGVLAAGVLFGLTACSGGTASSAGRARPRSAVQPLAAPSMDQARVTGYGAISVTGPSTRPVSVLVRGAAAAGLYRTIEGLHTWSGPGCAEEAQMYQIAFTSAAGTVDVAGDECGGYVSITTGGKLTQWTDRDCTLLTAVRRVLPASATATQRSAAPCA